MSKGTIIYIGGFELPDKNAAAHRPVENSKIFNSLGFTTVIIGVQKDEPNKILKKKIQSDNYKIENWLIPYPENLLKRFKSLYEIKAFLSIIEKYSDITHVICYNYQSIAFWRIRKYCKMNNIKIISDCTEWYSSNEGNLIFKITKYLDTAFRMRIINKKVDAVIVASNFLKDYYNKQNVVKLPMLFSKYNKTVVHKNETSDKVELIYAGIPFKFGRKLRKRENAKDRLDIILRLLKDLKLRNDNFIFNIYGLTKLQYLEVIPEDLKIIEDLGINVIFHGKVDNSLLREAISKADFSVFIRDENRVTMAGFPTKFSESILCGTPVISNIIGDIEEYLIEGVNGFFIDPSKEETIDKLENILKLGYAKIEVLKYNSAKFNKLKPEYWEIDVADFFDKLEKN